MKKLLYKGIEFDDFQLYNGWYGGYEQRNGKYEQVFNTDARGLFFSIKYYTDKGYSIKCLDETQEAEFMKGRKTFDEYMQEVCYVI